MILQNFIWEILLLSYARVLEISTSEKIKQCRAGSNGLVVGLAVFAARVSKCYAAWALSVGPCPYLGKEQNYLILKLFNCLKYIPRSTYLGLTII